MKTIELRKFESLIRVRNFGQEHGDQFPESSPAATHFATVAASVKELSGHAAVKMSAEREGKSNKATTRDELIDTLGTISRTARSMAAGTPGLEDKFHLPDPQTDQALLTAGRVFADDAEPFKSTFVAHSMPATFLEDLHALVDRFDQAIHDRESEKDDHASARANIKAALLSGMAAVHSLDPIIANQLGHDPGVMAAWRRDRRVAYPRSRKAEADAKEGAAKATTQPAGVVKAAAAAEVTS